MTPLRPSSTASALGIRFLFLAAAAFATVASLALPPSTPANAAEDLKLHVVNGRIHDYDGRERYFHGTNIVFKGPPYHPTLDSFDSQFSFCDEDMALLQSMGYNTIRLSVPWSGVEPQDGVFNETYLGIMRGIVDRAATYGLYTVVDFHQDAWNAKFCGNGVPDWAAVPKANDFPVPLAPVVPVDPVTGHPNRSTCDGINNNNWSAFYLTYATSTAVGAVYDNEHGLRDRLAAFWQKSASTFASAPSLIGYELMNEPFAGNVYADPDLLVPGVADRKKLQPMYDQINTAIRAVDPTHLILFQGVTWEVVIPIGEVDGFEHVPGGSAYANRSVLTWHLSVLPKITPDSTYFTWKINEAARLGSGIWVTEVAGSDSLDLLDERKVSWMHWDYKWFANLTWDNPGLFKTDGPYNACTNRTSMDACLDRTEVPKWARTFAKAVAGFTNSFSFNATTLFAQLSYQINPQCTQPTVLFASRTWNYPNGYSVKIDPPTAATWTNQDPDHILVAHTAPVAAINITVSIVPN